MTQAPPGWYQDPAPSTPGTPPTVRYWDGQAWTQHVQPAYAAAPAGPTTPDGQPLAGWWWRGLALVIDSVLLGVAANVVTLPAQLAVQREISELSDRYLRDASDAGGASYDFVGFWEATVDVYRDHVVGLLLVPLLLAFAYYAFFLRWKGATPGKLALGLRVRLRERPGTLPASAIVVRVSLQSLVPGLGIAVALLSGSLAGLALGYLAVLAWTLVDVLWAAGSRRRQAVHDRAAGTNVVRVR